MATPTLSRRRSSLGANLEPANIFKLFTGPQVPDPITFVAGEQWLDRGNLYPRQATLLKLFFLRTDLFTDYDYEVLDEWTTSFAETGNNGTQTDVLHRVEMLRADGYRWFREILLVMGRRAGKGHISALAFAYVLWTYLAKGDPQGYYGVDRDKQLALFVFAGKKEQAKANLFGDVYNVITGAPCFTDYINNAQTESITIFAPNDFVRMRNRERRGVVAGRDAATFTIQPKESTLMAARGPASFAQGYDEMAHVVAAGANRSAEDVYGAATPSLDQFGKDAFIVAPSSPWQKTGQFFTNYEQALEVDEETGEPVYPERLMVQLTSWDIYKDWERAHEIPLFPEGFMGDLGEYDPESDDWVPYPTFRPLKGAIQAYDAAMQRLEKANPDTFKVERRCLDPRTRVLCADLTWRPIGELQEGDRLVAVDEEPPEPRKERKMRTATVVGVQRSVDRAYRLTFGDGTSVVCSGNHRWFSTSKGVGGYRWRSLFPAPGVNGPRRILQEGDKIRFLVEPWEEDRSWEAGYLAGVYDGEGTAVARKRSEFFVTFVQNPGVVLESTLLYLRDKGFNPKHVPGSRRAQVYKITGLNDCMRFLGQIGPHRLRRQAIPQIWEDRALGHMNGQAGFKTIVKIEELPEQELVDIETTTGTFIAEGLVSHNSHFATVMDAYLNEQKVLDIFKPWIGRLPSNGPAYLEMQEGGLLINTYKAHADPSKSNCNFGLAVAHAEPDAEGNLHCVFDLIHHWEPQNWDDGVVDYDEIADFMIEKIAHKFYPNEITFDQFNSVATIQKINKALMKTPTPKQVTAYERTATKPLNWSRAEVFKTAINMGLVHAPQYDQAEVELKFLQDKGNMVVDHPDSGPVQTKDVADCMFECVYYFLGKQIQLMLEEMGKTRIQGGLQGGTLGIQKNPQGHQPSPHDMFSDFGVSRRVARNQGVSPGRGHRRR